MTTGRYRTIRHLFGSGVCETLMSEGRADGYSWALIKVEYSTCIEYALQINMSGWKTVYDSCFAEGCRMAERMLSNNPVDGLSWKVIRNTRCPSPWDDGYDTSCWFEAVTYSYGSEKDRLMSVVSTGRDWDDIDCDRLAARLCKNIKPVFDLLARRYELEIPK